MHTILPLGNDPFEVQPESLHDSPDPFFQMIQIAHSVESRLFRTSTHNPLKLSLPFDQGQTSEILPMQPKQIKGIEVWLPAPEKKIIEV